MWVFKGLFKIIIERDFLGIESDDFLFGMENEIEERNNESVRVFIKN